MTKKITPKKKTAEKKVKATRPPPAPEVAKTVDDAMENLFKKAEPNPEALPLICPHCLKEITNIQWRIFGGDRKMALIGCQNCRKVIGANVW